MSPLRIMGMVMSMMSMSFENLFKMRPSGVVSKKDMGERRIPAIHTRFPTTRNKTKKKYFKSTREHGGVQLCGCVEAGDGNQHGGGHHEGRL